MYSSIFELKVSDDLHNGVFLIKKIYIALKRVRLLSQSLGVSKYADGRFALAISGFLNQVKGTAVSVKGHQK